MNECWEQITSGMKVEVSCGEESIMKDAFWVATVISIHGEDCFRGSIESLFVCFRYFIS